MILWYRVELTFDDKLYGNSYDTKLIFTLTADCNQEALIAPATAQGTVSYEIHDTPTLTTL
jgi:hypothetical protein